MGNCQVHSEHSHVHGPDCGHQSVKHDDHMDYLHDGHLHHVHEGHVDEHSLSTATNSSECTPDHACSAHEKGHEHKEGCGHAAVPHADHTDYMVEGHLHHPCGTHCDNHGSVLSG